MNLNPIILNRIKNLLKMIKSKLKNKRNMFKKIRKNNQKISSLYFLINFLLLITNLLEFLDCIFLEDLDVAKAFLVIFFMIICKFKKRKEYIFISLWLIFINSCFNLKGKRKDLIHLLLLPETLPLKLDYCILISFKLLTLLMRLF